MTSIVVVLAMLTVLVIPATSQTLDSNGCLVEGAVYNETSGKCQCKAGYEGVGDMCCTPVDDHDVCYITGDPILRSISDQRVFLNVPCAVCVNVMQGETQSGKECTWEVLSSTTIREKGAIYNSLVKIAVSINKKSPSYFCLDGNRILEPVSNTKYTLDQDGKSAIVVEGETIRLSHDVAAGLWTVEGCQNRVVFRPKMDRVNGKPGVCMQSAQGSSKTSLQRGNLCNLQSNFKTDVPWGIGVLDNALNIRLNFGRVQRASHPDYDATCDKVDDLMQTFCQGISKDAMHKCGAILYHSDIRLCLDTMGVKGPNMADLFYQCLQTFCDGEKTLCDNFKNNPAIKTCIPSLTDCNQWPYYYE